MSAVDTNTFPPNRALAPSGAAALHSPGPGQGPGRSRPADPLPPQRCLPFTCAQHSCCTVPQAQPPPWQRARLTYTQLLSAAFTARASCACRERCYSTTTTKAQPRCPLSQTCPLPAAQKPSSKRATAV